MAKITKSRFAVATAVTLFCCVLLLVYFSAYVLIGKRGTISGPVLNGEAQFFKKSWQAEMFAPAAEIESLVRGKKVYVEQWDVPQN
jgi:hypothetical protein